MDWKVVRILGQIRIGSRAGVVADLVMVPVHRRTSGGQDSSAVAPSNAGQDLGRL